MTRPSVDDAQAAAIGHALLALLAALGIGQAIAPATYDADHLPPRISRDGFLRRHAGRVRDGVEGWTRTGQSRAVTAAAWALDVESETQRGRARKRTAKAPVPPANDDGDGRDELDIALGIDSRKAAG